MLAVAAFLSLAIWLVLVFFWGNFWRNWDSDGDRVPVPAPPVWPRVAAIVPARNEAATIASVVTSLLRQDYPGEFSVILVDDHSDDGTSEIARNAAIELSASGRVGIISAPELEPGWTGKLWALHSGVLAVLGSAGGDFPFRGFREMNPACATPDPTRAASSLAVTSPPDFFWFSDADVVHAPNTLRRLVSRAQHENYDLTSLMVLLQSKTFAERLLIPAFLYFFLMLYPPRWIANARAKTAGAAGGCVLLRRSALERIGGLATIRSEIIDDCSLARAVKRPGGNIWMGLTRASHSLRSYIGFAEIRDLIARTAFTQLRYSTLRLLGTLLGLAITFLVPVALTFSPSARIWIPALLAWCLMTASFIPTVNFYHLSPLWALLLPLSALFYSYATVLSALRYWLGRGGQWKGRAQASSPRMGVSS
jgi:glycosyltransferase involved in cell wall biosynthesis